MVKLRLKRMGKKGAPFYRIHTTQVKLKTKLL